MKLPEPDTVRSYNLFLSSSDEDETRRLRDRVRRLVDDVINPQLDEYSEAGVRLAVQRWEQTAAQRVEPGATVNGLFVAKARRAALTLVLLLDEIRPGTQEEFEAALSELDRQVSVLVFKRPGGTDDAKVAGRDAYLAQYEIRFSTTIGAGSLTATRRGSRSSTRWSHLRSALCGRTICGARKR